MIVINWTTLSDNPSLQIGNQLKTIIIRHQFGGSRKNNESLKPYRNTIDRIDLFWGSRWRTIHQLEQLNWIKHWINGEDQVIRLTSPLPSPFHQRGEQRSECDQFDTPITDRFLRVQSPVEGGEQTVKQRVFLKQNWVCCKKSCVSFGICWAINYPKWLEPFRACSMIWLDKTYTQKPLQSRIFRSKTTFFVLVVDQFEWTVRSAQEFECETICAMVNWMLTLMRSGIFPLSSVTIQLISKHSSSVWPLSREWMPPSNESVLTVTLKRWTRARPVFESTKPEWSRTISILHHSRKNIHFRMVEWPYENGDGCSSQAFQSPSAITRRLNTHKFRHYSSKSVSFLLLLLNKSLQGRITPRKRSPKVCCSVYLRPLFSTLKRMLQLRIKNSASLVTSRVEQEDQDDMSSGLDEYEASKSCYPPNEQITDQGWVADWCIIMDQVVFINTIVQCNLSTSSNHARDIQIKMEKWNHSLSLSTTKHPRIRTETKESCWSKRILIKCQCDEQYK